MVSTASTMVELGSEAPDFSLPDAVSGRTISRAELADNKALLVMFISRHCPYVQHVKEELARLGHDYAGRGVGIVAICSNDILDYPDDAPERLKEMAGEIGLNFPLCYDESQETAKAYNAACTPDFFLFDANRRLVYRGQLDDSRPENEKAVTGRDLRAALDAVLNDQPVDSDQRASLGCNIKWQAGNEPSYFGTT
jgi:peroxiredoxin